MRKIVHVITGLGTGGTEMMCHRLARHWQSRFGQHVIAWSPSTRALESEFRSLATCELHIGTGLRSYSEQWRWIHDIIKNVRPDAVLIHCFGVPHLITAAAARLAGVVSVAAWAGNPPPNSRARRAHFSLVLLASRLLRCPIASCSAAVESEFRRLPVGMPMGSRTVPNGIDVAEIASKASDARWTRSDMRPVIAMISRLDAIKDHATLLHAYSLLRKQMPEAQLWIIGDGVLRAALEELAIHLGIASSTLFLDSRTDIPNLLSQIDVFAFSTTRDEGFGIVLIEAMAASVPVVASNVPACREVLAGGEAGILVPPADPKAMTQALQFLFDNTNERRRITEGALLRVSREYSVEICARCWETMLFETPKPSPLLSECAS